MNVNTKLCFLICFVLSLNSEAQQISGQVAWWPLNGNFNDSSGNNFNGQPVGSPTAASDRFNNANGAIAFNGTTQMARFGDILDSVFCKSPVAKFTITGWAKSTSINPNFGAGIIIAKLAGATGPDQWSINHFSDSTVRGIVKTSSLLDYVEWKSTIKIGPNEWFFYTLMFDGSISNANDRVIFYVNGNSTVFSRSNGSFGSTCINTNQEITIGAGHAANNPTTPNNQFIGTIDDIRIFNRVLSLAEINQLYSASNVSIDNIESDSPLIFSIGENPTGKDYFRFSVKQPSHFTLYDYQGRLITEGRAESDMQLPLPKQGVYSLVVITNKGKSKVLKLIRN